MINQFERQSKKLLIKVKIVAIHHFEGALGASLIAIGTSIIVLNILDIYEINEKWIEILEQKIEFLAIA